MIPPVHLELYFFKLIEKDIVKSILYHIYFEKFPNFYGGHDFYQEKQTKSFIITPSNI